jgi:hypothetical protein
LELNAFVAQKFWEMGFLSFLRRERERGRWEDSVVVEAQKELQFESVSLC